MPPGSAAPSPSVEARGEWRLEAVGLEGRAGVVLDGVLDRTLVGMLDGMLDGMLEGMLGSMLVADGAANVWAATEANGGLGRLGALLDSPLNGVPGWAVIVMDGEAIVGVGPSKDWIRDPAIVLSGTVLSCSLRA